MESQLHHQSSETAFVVQAKCNLVDEDLYYTDEKGWYAVEASYCVANSVDKDECWEAEGIADLAEWYTVVISYCVALEGSVDAEG